MDKTIEHAKQQILKLIAEEVAADEILALAQAFSTLTGAELMEMDKHRGYCHEMEIEPGMGH